MQNETIGGIIDAEVTEVKYKETKNVELKERFSKTLLKTISAFANYTNGAIYIGIADDGQIVGIKDINNLKLKIENTVNDTITPKPVYELNILSDSGVMILEISVFKGQDGPYYYKNIAYMRNDTSTIAVDGPNLTRLILKSRNLTFDQLESKHHDLQFDYLKKELIQVLKIDEISESVLITIGLMQQGKYNNGAVLLADNGNIEQSFVDIVKFKLDSEVFVDRIKLNDNSLLNYYDEAISFFNKHFMPYQVVEGSKRITKQRVPLKAFREALANAIVHRDYLIKGGVQIAMFDNRIEIRSPGGLPEGITEEMYFKGLTSVLRNPVISYVFFRLGLIEQFGTGVKRIINSYSMYSSYPSFVIQSDQIKVILPVLDFDYSKLNQIDGIIAFLEAYPKSPRQNIEQNLKIEKSFAIRRLNELQDKGQILKTGKGPSTVYSVK